MVKLAKHKLFLLQKLLYSAEPYLPEDKEVSYALGEAFKLIIQEENMNGRRLYREYAQSLGREAIGFKELTTKHNYYGDYNQDVLVTYDSNGNEEKTEIEYKDIINWIIKTKKFEEK
jgi:hypothetical protein